MVAAAAAAGLLEYRRTLSSYFASGVQNHLKSDQSDGAKTIFII